MSILETLAAVVIVGVVVVPASLLMIAVIVALPGAIRESRAKSRECRRRDHHACPFVIPPRNEAVCVCACHLAAVRR